MAGVERWCARLLIGAWAGGCRRRGASTGSAAAGAAISPEPYFPPPAPNPPPCSSRQVAPLLIPSGNPAIQSIPGGYGAIATNRAGAGAGGSVLGGAAAAVAGLLPAEHGAKLQSELKKAGHKLGNFLQRF